MGLTGLWVCLMVLSAVSCLHQLSCVGSSVTGYKLDSGSASHLLDQSVTASANVSLECCVFVSNKHSEQCGPKTVQRRAEAFKHVILIDWLLSVWFICCTERCLSLLLFWWMLCLLWYQSPFGVDTVGGGWVCRCKALACFNVSFACLKMGKGRGEEKKGGGTKCSSVPKNSPPSRSVRCHRGVLCRECGDEEWVVYLSYIVMLEWVVSCSLSPCIWRDIAEWTCCQHVSASPSQHKFLWMFFFFLDWKSTFYIK